MPSASPAASPRNGLTRRTALAGALTAGVVASGCTSLSDPADRTAPAPVSGPAPDVELAAQVLAREQEMLARVRRTARRHAPLRDQLAAVMTIHVRHVDLLSEAVPDPGNAPTPSTATPAPTPPAVPADPARALRRLARQEDTLSLQNRQSAFAARSGGFARLLASMAAASAQQAVLLGQDSAMAETP